MVSTGPSGSPLVGRGDADRTAAITRSLLGYGLVAGPFYVVVGLAQAVLRDGFDLAHHDLSLLARGSGGWVQVVNFVLSGLMTAAAGVGLGRSHRVAGPRRGAVWGPRLIVGYGIGLVGAGIFRADPAQGFPPGTPAGAPVSISSAGIGHLVLGGLGFLCLIAACVVHTRRYATEGRRRLAGFSAITAVVFLAAFAGIATGSSSPIVVLGFWVGVVVSWAWLLVVCRDSYQRTPLLTPKRPDVA